MIIQRIKIKIGFDRTTNYHKIRLAGPHMMTLLGLLQQGGNIASGPGGGRIGTRVGACFRKCAVRERGASGNK